VSDDESRNAPIASCNARNPCCVSNSIGSPLDELTMRMFEG
jgi:hypothetical protein